MSQACGLIETLLQVSGTGSTEIFRFSVGFIFILKADESNYATSPF